jgi:hypothetical protein
MHGDDVVDANLEHALLLAEPVVLAIVLVLLPQGVIWEDQGYIDLVARLRTQLLMPGNVGVPLLDQGLTGDRGGPPGSAQVLELLVDLLSLCAAGSREKDNGCEDKASDG